MSWQDWYDNLNPYEPPYHYPEKEVEKELDDYLSEVEKAAQILVDSMQLNNIPTSVGISAMAELLAVMFRGSPDEQFERLLHAMRKIRERAKDKL